RIRLFETASGKELRAYQAMPGLMWLRWNPTRSELAVGSRAAWQPLDLGTGACGPLVGVPEGISWATWHPEGELRATGNERAVGGTRKIILWDAQSRQRAPPSMDGPQNAGLVLCFNHAGDRLVSTDWGALWRIWDWRSGRQLLALPALGTFFQFSRD